MLVSGNARILVSENAVRSNIAPLLNKLRKQKPEVFRHSLNVAYLVAEIFLRNYTDDLSLNIESDNFNEIVQGALLHDIGKLQIDDRVLLKQAELLHRPYKADSSYAPRETRWNGLSARYEEHSVRSQDSHDM